MTREITINSENFEVNPPFAEGHVLTEGEAHHLNQTWCENVGNSLRRHLKKAMSEGLSYAKRAKMVKEAAENYVMNVGVARGATISALDRETLIVARIALSAELRRLGYKIRKYKAENVETYEAALARIAEMPEIVEEARERLEKRERQLDIPGLIDAKPTDEESAPVAD